MIDKIYAIKQRFNEVNDLIIQPDILADADRYIKLNREYKELKAIVDKGEEYITLTENLTEAKDLLRNESDPEMKEMAKMEIDELEPKIEELEEEMKILLIPSDPEDSKNAVMEIRAGAGAVLPEAEELDVQLDMKDVKKDTYRAQGAGGQH
ncbi:unnamed protein product, partial [Cyprideis torosa]